MFTHSVGPVCCTIPVHFYKVLLQRARETPVLKRLSQGVGWKLAMASSVPMGFRCTVYTVMVVLGGMEGGEGKNHKSKL